MPKPIFDTRIDWEGVRLESYEEEISLDRSQEIVNYFVNLCNARPIKVEVGIRCHSCVFSCKCHDACSGLIGRLITLHKDGQVLQMVLHELAHFLPNIILDHELGFKQQHEWVNKVWESIKDDLIFESD